MWQPARQPPASRLPRSPISLILQFKRPTYLATPTASQWRHWNQPYFRFERRDEQQRVLALLERRLASDALVRYTAPAFWRYGELEAAHLAGQVIERSGFVSPSRLARHRAWTYVEPGLVGRPNPTSRRTYTFETVAEMLAMPSVGDVSSTELELTPERALRRHLKVVARAAREAASAGLRRQVALWQRRVQERELQLSSDDVNGLGEVAITSTVLARIGATWVISDRA